MVSHGHGQLLERLLAQLRLAHAGQVAHVVVTHNLASPALPVPDGGWPFELTEIHNDVPAGFGANHNRAFGRCATALFAVVNPDIELSDPQAWPRLVQAASEDGVGCAYPALFDPDGSRQENERELVTPLALVRRHLLRRPQRRVDWVSGAFLVVPAAVWRALGGFDERYFMYCEDVDLCVRLQLAGWSLRRAQTSAVHQASRASRRPGRHLAWHLASLLRLWTAPHVHRFAWGRSRRNPPAKSRQ